MLKYIKQLTIAAGFFKENLFTTEPFIIRWFLAIDHLANALTGGNAVNTISARTGYFSLQAGLLTRWYWQLLEKIIDWTFLPYDGPDHCFNAFTKEKRIGSAKYAEGSDKLRMVLGVFIILVNPVIAAVIRTIILFKPKYLHYQAKEPGFIEVLVLWCVTCLTLPLLLNWRFWWETLLKLLPF